MTKAANLASVGSVVTVPSGSAPSYQCRAWVNFNGAGTVSINASGNVSSITDNGVGSFAVNLTSAMSDTKYAVCGICSTTQANAINDFGANISTYTTTSFSCFTGSGYKSGSTFGTAEDSAVNVAVFR